jgi:HD-GYP domain-containing protein (c-di-GMP phosphodiesterase class II)
MISDRPYRRDRPQAEAVEELRRHASTQFDPDCVHALGLVLRAIRSARRSGRRRAPAGRVDIS